MNCSAVEERAIPKRQTPREIDEREKIAPESAFLGERPRPSGAGRGLPSVFAPRI